MKHLLHISIFLTFTACYTPNNQAKETTTPSPNITLEELHNKQIVDGSELSEELNIRAIVTTDDRPGNFYYSFFIENEGHGMEVLAEVNSLGAIYPVGTEVIISLKGLALGYEYGTLQLGMRGDAGSPPTSIGSLQRLQEHIFRIENSGTPSPHSMKVSELSNQHCGTLISLKDMRLITQPDQVTIWSGTQLFCDSQCDTIEVSTSSYANFAEQMIPISTAIELRGILQNSSYNGASNRFMLRLDQAPTL